MRLAVHSQSVKRGELQPALDLQREIAGSLPKRDEMVSGDNDLALRDHDAIYFSAIDDAGNAASKISSDGRIHHVSTQAKDFRHRRFRTVHSHFDFPLPHARVLFCALSDTEHNKIFLYIPSEYLRPSDLFQNRNGVHSGVYTRHNQPPVWHKVNSAGAE